MKASSLFLASALVVLLGAFLPVAPVSHAAPRTPVSCSNQQFYLGQDMMLITTKDQQLYKAAAQGWQSLTTPATDCQMHVIPEGTIYLHCDNRIYRSADDGATWLLSGHTPVDAPGQVFHYPLAPSPVPGLFFLGERGIPYSYATLQSSDGGVVWQLVSGVGSAMAMAFSPDFARDGLAFALIVERVTDGIWRSVDSGQTWTKVWNGYSPFADRGGVAFSPQFATDRTAFTDLAGGQPPALYKTTDGGATWFKINDLSVNYPAFSPDYGRDQAFFTGYYLTQDGGHTLTPIWDQANGSAEVWGVRRQDPLAAPPVQPVPLPAAHRYYLPLMLSGPPPLEFWLVAQEAASGNCYLYRSRDDGASWQEIAVP